VIKISRAVWWLGSVRRSSRLACREGEGCRGGVTSPDEESFGGRNGETTNPACCYKGLDTSYDHCLLLNKKLFITAITSTTFAFRLQFFQIFPRLFVFLKIQTLGNCWRFRLACIIQICCHGNGPSGPSLRYHQKCTAAKWQLTYNKKVSPDSGMWHKLPFTDYQLQRCSVV